MSAFMLITCAGTNCGGSRCQCPFIVIVIAAAAATDRSHIRGATAWHHRPLDILRPPVSAGRPDLEVRPRGRAQKGLLR